MSSDTPDPTQAALDTAEELRDDLEAIAESDLPFAYDAERILEALDQVKTKDGTTYQ